MVRLEAGLILIEVDYTSSKHALIPAQNYSPFELGLGRLVNLEKAADFVGRRALIAERDAGGPARRLVGLTIDYQSIERLYEAQDLPIAVSTSTWREQRPIYAGADRSAARPAARGARRSSSTSRWHRSSRRSNRRVANVELEWTVEGRRGRAAATVVPLPFFDPPRKRARDPRSLVRERLQRPLARDRFQVGQPGCRRRRDASCGPVPSGPGI